MYIQLKNVRLHYEVSGSGDAIILLHGNGEDMTIFDKTAPLLASSHTVYLIDSRGHGKSEYSGELHYSDIAEDTAEFIAAMTIEKPVLYGFSDGGIAAIMLAAKYPELLSMLIISGANLRPDGLKRAVLLDAEREYEIENTPALKMMLTEPSITSFDLAEITVKTVVLAGEFDMIKPEHTASIADGIFGSALEIIKGETHGGYIVHSEKLFYILKKYI